MWTEAEYGAEDAAYYRLLEARNYIAEDSSRYRRPIVTHVYREAIELYDRHLYEKGSCVYHMIRAELGDELFWHAIHTFVQDNAHQTVETIDLLEQLKRLLGVIFYSYSTSTFIAAVIPISKSLTPGTETAT